MPRQINAAGLALIQGREGCKLRAYRDARGILTIGWGHTGPDVFAGMQIAQERADQLLAQDLAVFEAGVCEAVRVPLTDNQFSALVSFAFNLGLGTLKGSTLGKKLNLGDYQGAADEFPRWTRAGGKEMPGLVARRAAERALFLTPDKTAGV